jgi:hypothetical protein
LTDGDCIAQAQEEVILRWPMAIASPRHKKK